MAVKKQCPRRHAHTEDGVGCWEGATRRDGEAQAAADAVVRRECPRTLEMGCGSSSHENDVSTPGSDDYNERSSVPSTPRSPSRAQGVGMDFFGDLNKELVRLHIPYHTASIVISTFLYQFANGVED